MQSTLLILSGLLIGLGYRNVYDHFLIVKHRYELYSSWPEDRINRAILQLIAGFFLALFFK